MKDSALLHITIYRDRGRYLWICTTSPCIRLIFPPATTPNKLFRTLYVPLEPLLSPFHDRHPLHRLIPLEKEVSPLAVLRRPNRLQHGYNSARQLL